MKANNDQTSMDCRWLSSIRANIVLTSQYLPYYGTQLATIRNVDSNNKCYNIGITSNNNNNNFSNVWIGLYLNNNTFSWQNNNNNNLFYTNWHSGQPKINITGFAQNCGLFTNSNSNGSISTWKIDNCTERYLLMKVIVVVVMVV